MHPSGSPPSLPSTFAAPSLLADSSALRSAVLQWTEKLNAARLAASALQAELNTVSAEPADSVLDKELAELEKAVPALEKKLERMQGKGGAEAAVSPADVDAMQRKFNGYLAAWKARKRGLKEMVGVIAETAAKSWKEKKFLVRNISSLMRLSPHWLCSPSAHSLSSLRAASLSPARVGGAGCGDRRDGEAQSRGLCRLVQRDERPPQDEGRKSQEVNERDTRDSLTAHLSCVSALLYQSPRPPVLL